MSFRGYLAYRLLDTYPHPRFPAMPRYKACTYVIALLTLSVTIPALIVTIIVNSLGCLQ